MGRRVGLGHLETLVENLKRDIAWGDTNHSGFKKTVVLSGGGTTTLTAAQSGAYCIFDTAATSKFVLPTPELGMNFTFINTILATADHVIQAATNDHGFLGGVISASTTAAKAAAFGAAVDGNNDFITMDGATLGGAPGSRIEVVAVLDASAPACWAVTGQVAAVGSSTATVFGDAQL